MNLFQLSLKNISGNIFRSVVIAACVMLVTGSSMWASLIILNAQQNIRLSLENLETTGADMIVLPRGLGYASIGMDNVNLPELLEAITALPVIDKASPQLRVLTAGINPYCVGREFRVIAFDPETDFSVSPWLVKGADRSIGSHQAYAGSLVTIPDGGRELLLAGYRLAILGQLSQTDTSMDCSLFITFETAREMFAQAERQAGLSIETSSVPIVLITIHPGKNPYQARAVILKDIPGISIVDNTEMGGRQLAGLLGGIPVLLATAWILISLFIGAVFAISVNDRRREIGVLRALGFPRSFIFRSLLAESFLIALSGGVAGIVTHFVAFIFLRDELVQILKIPLAASASVYMVLLAIPCLILTCAAVLLSVLLPAWRISRMDPVVALRG